MITVPQSINLLINRLGKRQDRNERQCREQLGLGRWTRRSQWIEVYAAPITLTSQA